MSFNPHLELFKSELTRNSLRVTKGRLALLMVILYHPMSSQQQIEELLADIDRSNVYRNVYELTKLGLLKQTSIGFKNVFELGDTLQPHHHHFYCNSCGQTTDITPTTELESTLKNMLTDSSFTLTSHDLVLYGLCRDCSS
jgi:Fur family transcriptional regulator, ferric uptake regulator